MSSGPLAAGIDIGGTRIKSGIVDLSAGQVLASRVISTERCSEEVFLGKISALVRAYGQDTDNLAGVGISIGSYVFEDGSIDGMSSFVPFLTPGYPLAEKLRGALCMPVRVENDARLICLAESAYGAGQGYRRVLSLTLGTGVGVGLSEDGRPFGRESFIHLAGHIKVRTGREYPFLDEPPCYCGIEGCLESTCSGSSLAKYIRHTLGTDVDNAEMFRRASEGDPQAQSCALWYADNLSEALNQYVYLYCPDVIVLGGGIAKGLGPFLSLLRERLTASVFSGQHTALRLSRLSEEAGILGAACLFAGREPKAK